MDKLSLAKKITTLMNELDDITRYKQLCIDECSVSIKLFFTADDYLYIYIPEKYKEKVYKLLLEIEKDIEEKIIKSLSD